MSNHISYIVFDDNGRITGTGRCNRKSFGKGIISGEHVIEGRADEITDKVVDGTVVRKTRGELQQTLLPSRDRKRVEKLILEMS